MPLLSREYKERRSPGYRSLRIALIYAAFSVLWILFSDNILAVFVFDIDTLTYVQTIKGWCFVLISACIIFILLHREIKGHIATKEKFKAIFDHHFQLTGLLNPEGVVISANPAALDFVGRKEEDVLGKFFWDTPWWAHSQEMQEKVKEGVLQAANGTFVRFETTHPKADGETRIMDFSINPVTNDSGEIIYLVPEGRDISSMKKVESALLESQTLYREAQAIAHIGHWRLDLVDDTLHWSDELFNIFELENKELSSSLEAFLQFVHPEDRKYIKDTINESIRRKEQYTAEHRILLPDGRIKHILERGRIEVSDDGAPLILIGTAQDITDKKEAEEKLQQSQKLEAIGTLAGGIAHDFNNILSGVIGYTEIALDDELPPDAPARTSLKQVLTAAYRARDLTKQILTFSRQSASKKAPINVVPIVREVLKLIRASLPANIEIKQELVGNNFNIYADPVQIHQIVTNLCSNAGYAMRDTGGVLTVSLLISEDDREITDTLMEQSARSFVTLKVEDTGPGMDNSVLEKIFNPFFTTKPKEEGTGLGLSVVHGIVEEHNGVISVKSKSGSGTVFTVKFPVLKQLARPEGEKNADLPTGTENILFVDDEIPIVEIYSTALKKLGYNVSSTTNSKEALELFACQPEKYDVVISDQTMPGMTGDKLAERIKSIRPEIPVILCTGFSHKLNKDAALKIGVRAILMKPISKKELAVTLRNIIDEKHS